MSEFILILSSVVFLFVLYLFFYSKSQIKMNFPKEKTLHFYPRNNLVFKEHSHHHYHYNCEQNDFDQDDCSIILNNTILKENVQGLRKNNSHCRCEECEDKLKRKLRLKHINEDVEKYKRDLGLKSVMW